MSIIATCMHKHTGGQRIMAQVTASVQLETTMRASQELRNSNMETAIEWTKLAPYREYLIRTD